MKSYVKYEVGLNTVVKYSEIQTIDIAMYVIMSLMSLYEKQSASFSKPSRTLKHSDNKLHVHIVY